MTTEIKYPSLWHFKKCPKRGIGLQFSIADCKKRYAKIIARHKGYVSIRREAYGSRRLEMCFYAGEPNDSILHRDNGPAVYIFHGNGEVYKLQYYQNGRQHRDRQPAEYQYDRHGKLLRREYYQDGQTHREDGYAIIGRRRSSSEIRKEYCWRGVLVDEQILFHPETQTIEQINQEENIERQRIRIERYGWMKFLKEVNAQVVHRFEDEISNTVECLLEYRLNDQRIRILLCSCPSTARVYPVEVSPEVETCAGAQKWLKGERLNEVQIIGAS